jgi:ferredoxin-NADP reductase
VAFLLQAWAVRHLELEIDGEQVLRSYTISSAIPYNFSITVRKRVPGGRVSNWLHEHLRKARI